MYAHHVERHATLPSVALPCRLRYCADDYAGRLRSPGRADQVNGQDSAALATVMACERHEVGSDSRPWAERALPRNVACVYAIRHAADDLSSQDSRPTADRRRRFSYGRGGLDRLALVGLSHCRPKSLGLSSTNVRYAAPPAVPSMLKGGGKRRERVHIRPEEMAAGLCALIATGPTVAAVATLATTVGDVLGPRPTPTIQQAVWDRYALLTQPGPLDGPG